MRKLLGAILLILLPLAGGVAGYFASPAMARAHRDVRLADRVARSVGGQPDASNELRAFVLSAEAPEAAYERGRAVERRFVIGGTLLGAWIGLVAVLRLLAMLRPHRRVEYEVDKADCLSCGRCYKYCPRERFAWREAAGGEA